MLRGSAAGAARSGAMAARKRPCLNSAESQVELSAGQLRIQRDGLLIRGDCLRGLLLCPGEHQPEAGKSGSVARIALHHSAPGGSFRQLSLLLKSHCIGGAGRLGRS